MWWLVYTHASSCSRPCSYVNIHQSRYYLYNVEQVLNILEEDPDDDEFDEVFFPGSDELGLFEDDEDRSDSGKHPGISKQALSDVIFMQYNRILPPGNIPPVSYEGAQPWVPDCPWITLARGLRCRP